MISKAKSFSTWEVGASPPHYVPGMKAVRLHELGGPEMLRVDDIDRPRAGEGEVLVRLAAAALNHRDIFITQGLYRDVRLPVTLGSDGAGECEGRAVVIDPCLNWGPDERVWSAQATILGMPRDGTFAEYVSVPKENVHPQPAHLSKEEAAALPLAGTTAYRALFSRSGLREGERVLITGVGGGVQTMALLFSVHGKASVAVSSGSDEKLARAKQLGATAGANYRTDPDWQKTLRKAMGEFDLVIDSAGGESFAKALSVLRYGGRAVTYGGTSGDSKIRMYPIFWNQLSIFGTSMGSPKDFRDMLAFVEKNRIKPVIDEVFELKDVLRAAQRLNSAQQFGKIVLRIAS